MRWYEYKMETDDLYAPDDLKAKLLAMTDQLTEEEKAQPMMKTAAPVLAQSAPVQPKKKLIRFPAKRVGALAACLAVCVVGYGAFATGQIGLGAKSSSPAVYYSADSTAAVMAAGGADRAAVDSPMAADYSLNTLSLESGADNGTAVYSENDAAAAARSTDHAKIIYTANLSLESKDYDAARAALDAALAEAGGYLESSSEYSDAGDSRSVSLTYRVPQQNYENFLAAVAEAGNVTYKNQQADDVTAQYMDVETRLENLKNQRTRLQQLQQQADNLSDLLEIESSLTDVQSQIESWQSQMDWYNDQVEECTVYVSLSEVSTYSPPSEGFGSRIASAFADGWQNFVDGVQQLDETTYYAPQDGGRITLTIAQPVADCETAFVVQGMQYTATSPLDAMNEEELSAMSAHDRRSLQKQYAHFWRKDSVYLRLLSNIGEGRIEYNRPNSQYYCGRHDFVYNFGTSDEPLQQITIVLPFAGYYQFDRLAVECQKLDTVAARAENLGAENLQNVTLGTNSLGGEITTTRSSVLVVQLPYSTGWSVTVDGTPAQVLRADTAFLGVALEPGSHTVAFTYKTPGLTAGAALSAAGVVLLAAIWAVSALRKKSKKRRK